MCAKVRAAVDARSDPDFIVIARTDAIAVEGFEAAIDRAKAYEDAGADVLFVEAPTTMEQLETIPKTFSRPTLYNMAMSGKTPVLPASEIEALGFGVVIYPGLSLSAAIPAIRRALVELRETGGLEASGADMASFRDFFELMGSRRCSASSRATRCRTTPGSASTTDRPWRAIREPVRRPEGSRGRERLGVDRHSPTHGPGAPAGPLIIRAPSFSLKGKSRSSGTTAAVEDVRSAERLEIRREVT